MVCIEEISINLGIMMSKGKRSYLRERKENETCSSGSFDRVRSKQDLVHAKLADHQAGNQRAPRDGCDKDEHRMESMHVGLKDRCLFSTFSHCAKNEDILLRVMGDLCGQTKLCQLA